MSGYGDDDEQALLSGGTTSTGEPAEEKPKGSVSPSSLLAPLIDDTRVVDGSLVSGTRCTRTYGRKSYIDVSKDRFYLSLACDG